MNGVHDMGGMQNYGPIKPEADEPWFHHPWERRAFALTLASGGLRQWNLDQSRSARESIPAAEYLASSYYEIWLEGLARLLVERGMVSPAEIESGRMSFAPKPGLVPLHPDNVDAALKRGGPTSRPTAAPAAFAIGDPVLTRTLNPASHTRLPRYCRGRHGVVTAIHGAHVYPDSHVHGIEDPQWLYTVKFEATALWGSDTTASSVHVDCWEPYLERAST